MRNNKIQRKSEINVPKKQCIVFKGKCRCYFNLIIPLDSQMSTKIGISVLFSHYRKELDGFKMQKQTECFSALGSLLRKFLQK